VRPKRRAAPEGAAAPAHRRGRNVAVEDGRLGPGGRRGHRGDPGRSDRRLASRRLQPAPELRRRTRPSDLQLVRPGRLGRDLSLGLPETEPERMARSPRRHPRGRPGHEREAAVSRWPVHIATSENACLCAVATAPAHSGRLCGHPASNQLRNEVTFGPLSAYEPDFLAAGTHIHSVPSLTNPGRPPPVVSGPRLGQPR